MPDEPYIKLREFLDRFPLGFPETPSGVEMKILKRLFSADEAETAVLLTPMPEEASVISARTGLGEEELTQKLEIMSTKGLLFRIRRRGKTFYNAIPFMIGLYEYSVKKIDRELAALFREYYDSVYIDEMGASNVPGFKVLPIEQTIKGDVTLFPFLKLKEGIKKARKIAVADCLCRKEAHLVDDGCQRPLESCLSFGAAAEYYIENGMGREVGVDEALDILEKADQAGLVHAGANTTNLSNICNCCPCCCASMKGITEKGHDKHKYMNALFEAIIDEDECIGCEDCIERCPVDAITVEDTALVDNDKCLGCGLCAGVCPSEAIALSLRPDAEEPFDGVLNLGMAILAGKIKNK